jgi:hypothetical protein
LLFSPEPGGPDFHLFPQAKGVLHRQSTEKARAAGNVYCSAQPPGLILLTLKCAMFAWERGARKSSRAQVREICFGLICVDCAPDEGSIRISLPEAMSVREAGVKLKSIRAGNTRFGEHHTPQCPACMAGTGRAFNCG